MNAIGQTRRGFLQRLAALGAAVAVGAVEVLEDAPKWMVGVDPGTGDWSKYAKPIVVELRGDRVRFITEMTERAVAAMHRQMAESLWYGAGAKSRVVGRSFGEPAEPVELTIRSLCAEVIADDGRTR